MGILSLTGQMKPQNVSPKKLFAFFNWFVSKYGKQLIVVTYSRIVFNRDFSSKTTFFYWQNGSIKCNKQIPEEQRNKIAGEAIEIIKLGEFKKLTFFVEDNEHIEIIETIAKILGKLVTTVPCGNSQNVKTLYKYSRAEGEWENAYFLTDGDNLGNKFENEANFIHLDRYCIENYLLDFKVVSEMTQKTEEEIKQALFNSILQNKEQF